MRAGHHSGVTGERQGVVLPTDGRQFGRHPHDAVAQHRRSTDERQHGRRGRRDAARRRQQRRGVLRSRHGPQLGDRVRRNGAVRLAVRRPAVHGRRQFVDRRVRGHVPAGRQATPAVRRAVGDVQRRRAGVVDHDGDGRRQRGTGERHRPGRSTTSAAEVQAQGTAGYSGDGRLVSRRRRRSAIVTSLRDVLCKQTANDFPSLSKHTFVLIDSHTHSPVLGRIAVLRRCGLLLQLDGVASSVGLSRF